MHGPWSEGRTWALPGSPDQIPVLFPDLLGSLCFSLSHHLPQPHSFCMAYCRRLWALLDEEDSPSASSSPGLDQDPARAACQSLSVWWTTSNSHGLWLLRAFKSPQEALAEVRAHSASQPSSENPQTKVPSQSAGTVFVPFLCDFSWPEKWGPIGFVLPKTGPWFVDASVFPSVKWSFVILPTSLIDLY